MEVLLFIILSVVVVAVLAMIGSLVLIYGIIKAVFGLLDLIGTVIMFPFKMLLRQLEKGGDK
jgi:hypothetical protein